MPFWIDPIWTNSLTGAVDQPKNDLVSFHTNLIMKVFHKFPLLSAAQHQTTRTEGH